MRRIWIKSSTFDGSFDDCLRLIDVFYQRKYLISPEEAYLLWTAYSEMRGTTWLTMQSFTDDRLFEAVQLLWE